MMMDVGRRVAQVVWTLEVEFVLGGDEKVVVEGVEVVLTLWLLIHFNLFN